MPRKGYKVITVDETTHSAVADIARELGKTIPKTIEHLVNKAKPNVTGQDTQKKDVKDHEESQEEEYPLIERLMDVARDINRSKGLDPDTGQKIKKKRFSL